jgi:hypothetical protein
LRAACCVLHAACCMLVLRRKFSVLASRWGSAMVLDDFYNLEWIDNEFVSPASMRRLFYVASQLKVRKAKPRFAELHVQLPSHAALHRGVTLHWLSPACSSCCAEGCTAERPRCGCSCSTRRCRKRCAAHGTAHGTALALRTALRCAAHCAAHGTALALRRGVGVGQTLQQLWV